MIFHITRGLCVVVVHILSAIPILWLVLSDLSDALTITLFLPVFGCSFYFYFWCSGKIWDAK